MQSSKLLTLFCYCCCCYCFTVQILNVFLCVCYRVWTKHLYFMKTSHVPTKLQSIFSPLIKISYLSLCWASAVFSGSTTAIYLLRTQLYLLWEVLSFFSSMQVSWGSNNIIQSTRQEEWSHHQVQVILIMSVRNLNPKS